MKKLNQDEKFMREALKEAKKSLKKGDWPVGCVVVMNGKIIARGNNNVHSGQNRLGHAEMNAIKKIAKNIFKYPKKCILYTTCEPCPMCFGAILLNRFKRIVFGMKENSGATHFRDYLPVTLRHKRFKFEMTSGVLADECYQLFIAGKPTKKLMKQNLLIKKYK